MTLIVEYLLNEMVVLAYFRHSFETLLLRIFKYAGSYEAYQTICCFNWAVHACFRVIGPGTAI